MSEETLQDRAAKRDMTLPEYMNWRAKLRGDYKSLIPYRAFARCTGFLLTVNTAFDPTWFYEGR